MDPFPVDPGLRPEGGHKIRQSDRVDVVDVRVQPAAAFRFRPRLFAALAQAFPVRFRPSETLNEDDAAALVFGDDVGGLPDRRGRTLVFEPEDGPRARREVRFADSPLLDARLRGRVLVEGAASEATLPVRAADEVFATIGDRPVWIRREGACGATDAVAQSPPELATNEVLRDHLEPERFLGLLPLVHFLREVSAPIAWQTPPSRAAFVIDDPNLHWNTYGCLRYSELVDHGRHHRYHASIAMVPIDGWHAHRPTVRLFRDSTDVLSLSVHGNDHRMHELGRLTTAGEARRVVAQAIRRTAAFESRTGLSVSRVMIPPYEACSAASMAVMLEVGLEAVSLTRPYPWLPLGPGHSPYATPDGSQVLSGWSMAELTAEGVPVLIRRQFEKLDEIVLRGYLNQPIILYGHVSDLAGGLEPLAEAAAVVNALPSVLWGSLEEITLSNFESRRSSGGVLEIRPFARRLRFHVEPDIEEIRLVPPSPEQAFHHGAEVIFECAPERRGDIADGVVSLPAGRSGPLCVQISWKAQREVSPETIPPPALAPLAVSRRLLVEARDRLQPIIRTVRPRAIKV